MDDVTADSRALKRMAEADTAEFTFNYPKVPIISYAQTHEDVLLWRALHSVERGFYIDVGAHDPTRLSVTRAFYEHGWHGINIEPNRLYAEKLRKERPRDLTLEVALGPSPGMATFYEFGDTGFSTLVRDIADQHIAAGLKVQEHRVPVTTLAAITDDLGDQEVHFLKVDVGGGEPQVLSGANFGKIRPWIVLIEAVQPMTSIPSHKAWEHLVLNAGYKFVFFDGLNRFYLAEEKSCLVTYFSVPVSPQDPFRDSEVIHLSDAVLELERDKGQRADLIARLSGSVADLERERITQANELVRLSQAVADLERERVTQANEIVHLSEIVAADLERVRERRSTAQRDQVRHEMPRLGNNPPTPIACDARDAEGLLRIVEAQAADLVRLRRAHSSAQAAAARRLDIILGVFEWVRSTALAEICRVQDAISDVIERSRWRRAGQRLGTAKRLAWETEHWRTELTETNGSSQSTAIPRILDELDRLYVLLNHFRRSRWRKLGHWLGVAKRLPWESGAWRDALLVKPFPVSAGADEVKTRTWPSSYTGFIEYANERFLQECRGFAIDVILDVGANSRQFAQSLRGNGYHGHIISFEPLSTAHAMLGAAANSDPLWDVAERCALGAKDGWGEINIADNSYSLILDLHREAAPQSVHEGKESCRIITLDSYMERTFSDPTTLFGLKINTQGYEAQVLAGLVRNRSRVKVIVCEMSLMPSYADGSTISELSHLLGEFGYRCVALSPESEDPRNGVLLQVNGVFVSRE